MNIFIDNLPKEILYLVFDFLKEKELINVLLVDKKSNDNVYSYIKDRKFSISSCCEDNRVITMRLLYSHPNSYSRPRSYILPRIFGQHVSYNAKSMIYKASLTMSLPLLLMAASYKSYNIIDFVTMHHGFKNEHLYPLIEGGGFAGDENMINYVLSHKWINGDKYRKMWAIAKGMRGAARGNMQDMVVLLIFYGKRNYFGIKQIFHDLLLGACEGGSINLLECAISFSTNSLKLGLQRAIICDRPNIINFLLDRFPDFLKKEEMNVYILGCKNKEEKKKKMLEFLRK